MTEYENTVLVPVYPRLAGKTLEKLSETLTLMHRNDAKNPNLTAELKRAAAAACNAQGVVGDAHIAAVADLAASRIFKSLPAKHVQIQEIPNVERSKDAFTKARRDYIVDLFGQTPLPLLAAWMLEFAGTDG